jgi:hypothetical protein
LRAFTPRDAKAVKVAAETFRPNPRFDAATVITELGVGEALVSTLQPGGVPGIVERTLIRPPCSRLRPAEKSERSAVMVSDPVGNRYDRAVDRESAYERLQERAQAAADEAEREKRRAKTARAAPAERKRRTRNRQGVAETVAKSVLSSVGRQLGRELLRGLFGTLTRGR